MFFRRMRVLGEPAIWLPRNASSARGTVRECKIARLLGSLIAVTRLRYVLSKKSFCLRSPGNLTQLLGDACLKPDKEAHYASIHLADVRRECEGARSVHPGIAGQ